MINLYTTTSDFQKCLHIIYLLIYRFHTILSIILLLIDLYYCQNDQADNAFENFYKRFLQDISLRKLNDDKPADRIIFMVLELPLKNRQNNEDVLFDDIENIARKYSLEGKC